MKHTANLRLAVTLAAAIASVACSVMAADSTGPESAKTAVNTRPPSVDQPGKASKRQTYPFRGIVGTFDSDARVLTLEGKTGRRAIRITDATRLERHGKPGSAEDLKPGEKVGGTLKRDPEGHEEALLVRVGPKSDPAGDETEPSTGASKKEETK